MNIKRIIREELDSDMDFISEPIDYSAVEWDVELLKRVMEDNVVTIRIGNDGIFTIIDDKSKLSGQPTLTLKMGWKEYLNYTHEEIIKRMGTHNWTIEDVVPKNPTRN